MFSLPSQTLYFKLVTAATNTAVDLTLATSVTVTLTSTNNTIGPINAVIAAPTAGRILVNIPSIDSGVYTATALIDGVTLSQQGTLLKVEAVPHDEGAISSFYLEDYNNQVASTTGLSATIVLDNATLPMADIDFQSHTVPAPTNRTSLHFDFVSSFILKINTVVIPSVLNSIALIQYNLANISGTLGLVNSTNTVTLAPAFGITVDGIPVHSSVDGAALTFLSLGGIPGSRKTKFNLLQQLQTEPEVISF